MTHPEPTEESESNLDKYGLGPEDQDESTGPATDHDSSGSGESSVNTLGLGPEE